MVGNAFCSSGRILRTKGQDVSPDLCGETKNTSLQKFKEIFLQLGAGL